MKAKKSKQISKFCSFASALLALVAVIMIFLPQIAAAGENADTTYNGLQLAFGATLSENSLFGQGLTVKIDFSFMNLLAYVLVLAGLVLIVLQLAGISKGKLTALIAAAALIAGGILFFFVLDFSSFTTASSGLIQTSTTVKFAEQNTENVTVWKLGVGAIIGGITAILAGVLALAKNVLN